LEETWVLLLQVEELTAPIVTSKYEIFYGRKKLANIFRGRIAGTKIGWYMNSTGVLMEKVHYAMKACGGVDV
jgi:hypothetical protein